MNMTDNCDFFLFDGSGGGWLILKPEVLMLTYFK